MAHNLRNPFTIDEIYIKPFQCPDKRSEVNIILIIISEELNIYTLKFAFKIC